jgi:hypothetical protein
MTKFDDKVNGNTVNADEYNNMVRASKNAIEDSGQTIDATNTQLSEAIANYVGSGNYYTDSGSANTYVLGAIGSFKAPASYQDGMEVRFRAGNASTTASTINVAGLGVKNIKLEDGTTDIATEIVTTKDTVLRYDNTGGVFRLASSTVLSASQAQQETGTATDVYTSPGTQQYHESACKAWVKFTGSTGAITASYNVTSVTRNSAGDYTINFTTAFSSADYSAAAIASNSTSAYIMSVGTGGNAPTTTALRIQNPLAANDSASVYVACFGDQ